ncbi:hypothetical protein GKA01_05610 [Gluconobacter kanchanaburiensis NBRC 103587]|uniref:GGDEF domain-containing protein n=1 Tax=Gluconobacter kanchanaburiensis NBRC 103587 TaxID=1307948 RepID=A0A511B4R4_9PROT|nr:hypothetical protein [Gluconobacter kanchanaburiensis]GBR67296.1 hypothetical protein AA103587_0214 [Gluconobacter kanchanaburiensis NBRC 103587]GEK95364.1 hypothetical protein GKA01_05610 [Gluconobacter kanchanaburiensis NBRC 103587]
MVVFPGDTVKELLATAQHLRSTFSTEMHLIAGGGLTTRLNIGAALCHGNGMTRTELLEMTDNALYDAKQAG